jgi:hypothetical protein
MIDTTYRIIEVKIPELDEQHPGEIDWVPDINYRYEYHIERLNVRILGWFDDWVPAPLPNKFSRLKRAEQQIEFMRAHKSSKVVKEY